MRERTVSSRILAVVTVVMVNMAVGKTGGLISKYMRGIKSLSQVHMYIYIYDYRVRGKRSGLYTYVYWYLCIYMYMQVYT
jgi:hypothetical protein